MRKLQVFLNRNKTFMLWFSSYFLVLMVSMVIYFALFINVNRTAKAEVERANSMMLNQFLQFMDDSLKEIELAADSIYSDTKIQSLMYKTRPLSSSSIYKIVEIQEDLRSYKLFNMNIDNIYVYCKRSDLIVSIYDTYRSQDTYYIYSQLTDLMYEDWLSSLNSVELPRYRIFKYQSDSSQEFDKLTYSRPFPFVYTENMAGMVIISVDLEQLKQKFFESYNVKDQYCILDEQGGVLTLNKNPAFPKNIDFAPLLDAGQDISGERIDVPGFTCLSVKSSVNDWLYVRFVDMAEVNKRIYMMKITFVISVCLSLILGTAIAFLLTRHNYNPLQQLKQLVKGSGEDQVDGKENDFQYIIHQVKNLQVEKDSMKREMNTHLSTARSTLLIRILKRELQEAKLESLCKVYGLETGCPLVVVLAALEENSVGNKLTKEHQILLITDIFDRVLSKPNIQVFITEPEPGLIACLTLLRADKQPSKALEDVKTGIGEATVLLSKVKPEIMTTMAFSAVHPGMEEAHAAYTEAHEALEYCWLTGTHMPLDFKSIQGKPSMSGYIHQALQKDLHFINCIRALDFPGARRSLNEIIDQELSDGGYSVRIGRFRMYGLISMLIGAVGELGNVFTATLFSSNDYIERLSKCRMVQELRVLINEIIDSADSLYKERNASTQQISEARSYIESNYADPNLSVAMVADAMNLHPSYLSQIFRREIGYSTMDYIHMTRLNMAKTHLNKCKVKDVADKVGYNDVRTLIRVFRKYEGITPGKFKELGLAGEDFEEKSKPSQAIGINGVL